MKPLVIGIAGGTGSGKTTIAQGIAEGMPDGAVHVLPHDNYYRDRADLSFEERSQLNFDHPDSLETSLLVAHLRQLRAGEPVEIPQYDFTTHRRTETWTRLEPSPVLIVEGILVLAEPELRSLFDIKLFVDTDADIRAFRRVRRDLEHRGRSFDSVRDQYYATVRPMHLTYVEPSKRFADLVIPEGGDNRIAMDVIVAKLLSVVP